MDSESKPLSILTALFGVPYFRSLPVNASYGHLEPDEVSNESADVRPRKSGRLADRAYDPACCDKSVNCQHVEAYVADAKPSVVTAYLPI